MRTLLRKLGLDAYTAWTELYNNEAHESVAKLIGKLGKHHWLKCEETVGAIQTKPWNFGLSTIPALLLGQNITYKSYTAASRVWTVADLAPPRPR